MTPQIPARSLPDAITTGPVPAVDLVAGTETYRVSEVLAPEFPRSWHEAVALVQEVAAQLVPGANVPDPDDLLLDRNGTLELGFGPDAHQNPVSALGLLLQSLLHGVEAPGGLRALATDNAKASPALSSLEAFQRALEFYERPDRASDLQELVTRLRRAPVGPDPDAEFERLREKLAGRAPAAPPAPQESEPVPVATRSRRAPIVMAALVVATLGALIAYARPGYLAIPGAFTDRVEQKLADTISRGLNKSGTSEPSAAARAGAPAEASEPAGATAHPGAVRRGSPAAPAASHTAPLASRPRGTADPARIGPGVSAPTEGRTLVPSVADITPAGPAFQGLTQRPTVVELGRVVTYSSDDPDVEPPALSRPQLPRRPEPGDDTGYFDVVVTESGEVERVQLFSPMRRFQERMLMAAAKAWKFRPAMRNGEPVRYRLRIAIILTDKP